MFRPPVIPPRRISLLFLLLLSACFELKGVKSHYPLKNVGKETKVSVLTFNILSTLDLGAIQEGYPTWWSRRKAVFAVIDNHDPDLVSLQEPSPTQFEEFRDRFGGKYFVIHKLALTTDAIILLKRDRFDLLEKGFWSLEAPVRFGIRRIAVWAKVREKSSGRELMFVGTHLDARRIKVEEIKFIKRQLADEQDSGAPLILAGDMNVSSDVSDYSFLIADGWKDSYLGDLHTEVKTFPLKNPTRRIDHVFFFGKDIESVDWQRVEDNGKEFSDHFPVFVQFHIDGAH